ncbi:MAG: ABC transporter permease [bacterium]
MSGAARGGAMRRLMTTAGPPLVTVLLALALWQAAVTLAEVPEYLCPSPLAVFEGFVERRAMLLAATARTAAASFLGFGIAAVLGVAAGTLLASIEVLRRGVYPLANLLQMVPVVAIAPLLTIWFGYGLDAVVASAVIVSVFPVIANTVDGLRSTDPELRELFAIHGAGRFATWHKLEMWSALPGIVTGLRIAAGLAVIGAVVGEFVSGFAGADAPIGIVILTSIREARTDLVFAAILLSALVGFVLFGLVSGLGDRALRRWHPSSRAR